MMRKFLSCLMLSCVILCAGCSSSPSVRGYTDRYDTAANLSLFKESALYPMAEGFYQNRNRSNSPVRLEEEKADPYYFTAERPYTTPLEPFLAVSVRRGEDGQPDWHVVGGSGKSPEFSGVRTLAVCIVTEHTADYKETGYGASRRFEGTTESARILYLDARTASYIQETEIAGKPLPKRTSGVPHYTLSNSDLVSRIRKDLTLPFTLSPDGEITGGKLDSDRNGYLIPDGVKKIAKLEMDPDINRLALPASVEEIAPGVLPRMVQSKMRNFGEPEALVLTVVSGSRAETFAREGGYAYKRPDGDAKYIWMAGCESVLLDQNQIYKKLFPNTPDGDFEELMKSGYLLSVEEGSPAEEYARAHQYPYSYGDKWERHCWIGGLEWKRSGTDRILIVPAEAVFDEDLLAWIKKQKSEIVVAPGSSAEEALRAAGVEYRTENEQ